jgi:hypothetical protein
MEDGGEDREGGGAFVCHGMSRSADVLAMKSPGAYFPLEKCL